MIDEKINDKVYYAKVLLLYLDISLLGLRVCMTDDLK